MDKEASMRTKSFKLGGHSIVIKYMKTVKDPETGHHIFGLCNPMTNEIHLATHLNGVKLAEDVIRHSLKHEVVHYILVLMNQHDLNSNEPFVDMLGMFWHQFDETQK